MKYIDDIRDWLVANKLAEGYKVQPYEWKDSAITTDRFIVIQPDGGLPVNGEFRSPFARLLVIGRKSEPHQIANGVIDRANGIIKKMQVSYSHGRNFLMVPVNDISITARTEDGRPYCQINIRILANNRLHYLYDLDGAIEAADAWYDAINYTLYMGR